jgi:hypothetical protein
VHQLCYPGMPPLRPLDKPFTPPSFARPCPVALPRPACPRRVLANNDVPTGAARIPLEVCLPADWEGWGPPIVAAAGQAGEAQAPAPAKRVRARRSRRAAQVGLGCRPWRHSHAVLLARQPPWQPA